MNKKDTRSLTIFDNRSEYVVEEETEVFYEGKVSDATRNRASRIKTKFASGFLDNLIESLKKGKSAASTGNIDKGTKKDVQILVDSVTSEVGRALVALTVMQLSIKSIAPEQNIRLHKGSSSSSAFSWVDGISMRSLDKNYVTPALRRHNLVRLNADGFMMTRSLAENYPYTRLYKARLRGAREHWLNIVEAIEGGKADSSNTLNFLISLLLKQTSHVESLASQLIKNSSVFLAKEPSFDKIKRVIFLHMERSDYAARLMEISMHA